MKLNKKKQLAARTLDVGIGRIKFDSNREDEIKEAITKQDIKDLYLIGVIKIKEIKGRKKNIKRKTRRRVGKIKIKVKKRKENYVKLTRKLRDFIKKMKNQEKINKETYKEARKGIRTNSYKSKRNLKESLGVN